MVTPITQGLCKPFTFKALDLWHKVKWSQSLHVHIHMHLHLHLHLHLQSHLHTYLNECSHRLHTSLQNRESVNLYITVNVGPLVNWRFDDMQPMTRGVRNLFAQRM